MSAQQFAWPSYILDDREEVEDFLFIFPWLVQEAAKVADLLEQDGGRGREREEARAAIAANFYDNCQDGGGWDDLEPIRHRLEVVFDLLLYRMEKRRASVGQVALARRVAGELEEMLAPLLAADRRFNQ